ncbi:hypothetical protein C6W10_13305 [Plantactinospora sp. BB1]|nr:hypothetical protein C6W10_13305 [Plantactinospora sp. BB1]
MQLLAARATVLVVAVAIAGRSRTVQGDARLQKGAPPVWITYAFVLFLLCVAFVPVFLVMEAVARYAHRKLPVSYYRVRAGWFAIAGLAFVAAMLGAALEGGRTRDWVLFGILVVFLGGMLALRVHWWRQERRRRSPLRHDDTAGPLRPSE